MRTRSKIQLLAVALLMSISLRLQAGDCMRFCNITMTPDSSDNVKTANQIEEDNDEPLMRSVARHFAIYYCLNGVDIDGQYLDNIWQLGQIRKFLSISPKIDSITIRSFASPEGPYSRNVWLSRKRAESAKDFLLKMVPEGSSLTADKIKLDPVPENWDGLTEEIEKNYHEEDRELVLGILRSDIGTESKKMSLKSLDGGRSWRHIIDENMPRLRYATWICVWVDPGIDHVEKRFTDYPSTPSRLALIPQPEPVPPVLPEYERQMVLAGRTNLLVPGLNFGVEIPVGRHFSIGADYWYPWWLAKSNKYCGEMLGWFIDGKYWFTGRNGKYEWTRDDKLKGHALGLYAGGGYYDYQKRKSGYQGEYIDFGVDYTFGMPIGRKKWMRMEFNVGVGCILTQARHYTPTSDWADLIKDPDVKQNYYTFFGPTRVGISFVLPLIVKRQIKGGAR